MLENVLMAVGWGRPVLVFRRLVEMYASQQNPSVVPQQPYPHSLAQVQALCEAVASLVFAANTIVRNPPAAGGMPLLAGQDPAVAAAAAVEEEVDGGGDGEGENQVVPDVGVPSLAAANMVLSPEAEAARQALIAAKKAAIAAEVASCVAQLRLLVVVRRGGRAGVGE